MALQAGRSSMFGAMLQAVHLAALSEGRYAAHRAPGIEAQSCFSGSSYMLFKVYAQRIYVSQPSGMFFERAQSFGVST